MYRTALIALFLALPAGIGAAPARVRTHIANTPEERTDEGFKWRRGQIRDTPNREKAQLVFVGDSITQGWGEEEGGKQVWRRYWAPLSAVNLGIAADRTEHVLWRLQHGDLEGLNPRVIVLMAGTNNNALPFESRTYRCTPQQTAEGVKAILETLKARCPGAKILVMAIFPRGEEESDPVRRRNNATNALIRQYADCKRVFFMDIGAKFLKPNGDLSVVNMPDMLHPSRAGYRIWAAAIYARVKELMR